ncbi:cytochrome b561 [Monaibacterium marinum]|uniref:Cytochrome b561 n=1 Tax=Pontivivens marinum TaxID=1690039 RepID=A0A2C9CRU2_9RHOB|nr:cytochrome b [Monaibacterium marinum]SOH93923.1 cytochrome b561 [Monaibacterium marinum]
MSTLTDTPQRYGRISRILHWGMAALFAAQFLSAILHWALPRGNELRELLWSYHTNLGATLFLLVMLRGIWGLMNIPRRPHHTGLAGRLIVTGHVALYALMVAVPAVRLLAAATDTRGFSYFGVQIFSGRETALAWAQAPAEWHGEMGWILALLVVGHIALATLWHGMIKRDGTLKRMVG